MDYGLWQCGEFFKQAHFEEKRAKNGHFFIKKNRQKTGKIEIHLFFKRALSSFAFPFFIEVFTVLQVHPKTRLSITWPLLL